jgi:hypothetical protein
MVFLRTTRIGPENRTSGEAYTQLEERLAKYMEMDDGQWLKTYDKMYYDRRYPGLNNFKLEMIPAFFYIGMATTMSYELYMTKNVGGWNFVKLGLIPAFGLLAIRNFDRAYDIMSYRMKYPEMYQP